MSLLVLIFSVNVSRVSRVSKVKDNLEGEVGKVRTLRRGIVGVMKLKLKLISI